MATMTRPAPTTKVRSGKYGPFNQTKREAETRWVVGESAKGHVVVEVTTHHDPDSKVFRSTATWGTVETGEGYSVFSWSSDHAYVVLGREPVARYSVKALEAEHQRVLALAEQSPGVEGVFAEAAQAVLSPEA